MFLVLQFAHLLQYFHPYEFYFIMSMASVLFYRFWGWPSKLTRETELVSLLCFCERKEEGSFLVLLLLCSRLLSRLALTPVALFKVQYIVGDYSTVQQLPNTSRRER